MRRSATTRRPSGSNRGYLMAHAALGQALVALGRFREAEAATRRCLDRLPQGHERRSNVLAQLGRCERLIALQDRLPAVLPGEGQARRRVRNSSSSPSSAASWGNRPPRHACTPRPSTHHRDWPRTSTPSTAIGQLAPQRWLAAVAAGTPPGTAKRSGRGGASGPASGFGPRSPSGPACWTAVRPQIASWLPRSWRICGPIPNWTGCWTTKRWIGCRRPSARNAARCGTRSIS